MATRRAHTCTLESCEQSTRPVNTAVSAKNQLSVGLKERLRKCGRVYRSPATTESRRVCSTLSVNTDTCESDKTSLYTTPKVMKHSEFLQPLAKRLCLTDDSVDGGVDAHVHVCDNSLTTMNERQPGQNTQGHNLSNANIDIVSKDTNWSGGDSSTCKVSQINDDLYSSGENNQQSECAIINNPSEVHVGLCREEAAPPEPTEGPALDLGPVEEQVNRQELSQLLKHKEELQCRVAEKEEVVRKLNLVKMYRSKNDLAQLGRLINKWQTVSQQAVTQLYELAPEPKASLTELINYLHLDHQLIGFNPEDESFS